MPNPSSQYNFNNKVLIRSFSFFIGAVFFIYTSVFAAGASLKTSSLAEVQKQARDYRSQGLEQQKIGNLDGAMALYQKTIELDPAFAVAYNDLGVIYEAKGMGERAEDSYQSAIMVDPNYLSSYSNLALLYETRQDLEKAAVYWKKRAELGSPKDSWTQKAKERFAALMRMTPTYKKRIIEEEIADLSLRVEQQKKLKKEQDIKKCKEYIASARKLYNSSEYDKAMNETKLALSLVPQEKEALSLIDSIKAKKAELEKKAREEQKKKNIANMHMHFEAGLKYYQQDNLKQASEEFAKVKELIVSPQKKN